MKLTQQAWDSKTSEERLQFLTAGATELRQRHGVDGRAKVGEARVITVYSVVMNGVTLGESKTLSIALKDTADFIASLENAE